MQFARLFGIAPLGIGLTLLTFLWWPSSSIHAPPLVFKMFGSFMSIPFILIGGGILFGNLSPKNRLKSLAAELKELQEELEIDSEDSPRPTASGYQCSSCGATLDQTADVSPHGDVKCEHCGKWFNIHQS